MRNITYEPPCKSLHSRAGENLLIELDSPKEVENAPCHVQLIGRRMKDEMLMEHAKMVESILKN